MRAAHRARPDAAPEPEQGPLANPPGNLASTSSSPGNSSPPKIPHPRPEPGPEDDRLTRDTAALDRPRQAPSRAVEVARDHGGRAGAPPMTWTFLSPAAVAACATACLIPSVTKMNVVSPFTIASCGRWVSTNTGIR